MASGDDKKYFDVTKPGKSAPTATARPVIVTNRTMVKDPTLRQADDIAQVPPPETHLKSEAKIVAPLDNNMTSQAIAPQEPTSGSAASEENSSNDSQVEQGRIEQEKLNANQHADEERKKQADELIKGGKYVVPVGHIKRNRKIRRSLLALLLAILLVVVIGDLLIDAGIVKTDIEPLVDLINN